APRALAALGLRRAARGRARGRGARERVGRARGQVAPRSLIRARDVAWPLSRAERARACPGLSVSAPKVFALEPANRRRSSLYTSRKVPAPLPPRHLRPTHDP